MPYIRPSDRTRLQYDDPENVGDLTYTLTLELIAYLGDSPSFQDYAEAIAALECAKFELYRRRVGEHEDRQIAANGDVY